MRIELASEADLDGINQLARQALHVTRDLQDLRREWASAKVCIPVIRIESCPMAGFANVWRGAGEFEITEVVIQPALRRTGLGRRLLGWIVERAFNEQVERIHLEVRANNRPAIELYERFGFLHVGLRRHYYRDGTDARLYSFSVDSSSSECSSP